MRVIYLVLTTLILTVLAGGWLHRGGAAGPATQLARPAMLQPVLAVSSRRPASLPAPTRADSVVRFALAQLGTAYCYAGASPTTGFDCSGFVHYIFGRFAVPMPHATALLIGVGRPVARARAQPGDIVVFAGTAPGSTAPGHAGIVISAAGKVPVRFVHASSARLESGVKISQVEGSGYEQRFLQVRRVL